MGKITALRTQKGRDRRMKVYLDDRPAFRLEAELVNREGLRVEQELSDEQIQKLVRLDQFQRCLNAANHYLDYRPRSESELRQRLHQRGFDSETNEAVIARLKDQGLIDDRAFAQFWADNRESFSPRSRWLTRRELKRKGVSDDVIDQVVSPIDDADSAYRAALGKARHLAWAEYEEFRDQLGGYLRRRGFSYEVTDRTIQQIWRDQGGDNITNQNE
jgi:regulatory protein